MKSVIQRALASAILFLFLNVTYAQQTTQVSTTVNPSEELYQHYKQNGIDAAIKMYDSSPSKGDEYTLLSEPLNVLGYRLMDEGDLDAAEKAFKAQIDEYPNEANPYDSYADLLMEKGDEAGAKKNYQKAIELSATMDDAEAKQQMLEASKSKLAMLEGAGSDLQFLKGKWNTKMFRIQDGEKNMTQQGSVEFSANGKNNVLTGIMKDKNGDYVGTRIIAYDAIDEQYDMVFAGNSPNGIETSVLKIEESSPQKVVFTEAYEENGKKMMVRHILNKASGDIAWEIHELKGDQENPVAEMTFTKQ